MCNFYNKLKIPILFPTCFARRKVREIIICCRNCSQGSYSYFDLPLDTLEHILNNIYFVDSPDHRNTVGPPSNLKIVFVSFLNISLMRCSLLQSNCIENARPSIRNASQNLLNDSPAEGKTAKTLRILGIF